MSLTSIKSVCPLCGCGCKLNYVLDANGDIVKSEPIIRDVKRGYEFCFKGILAWKGIYHNRIDRPYIRLENGELKAISWKEAMDKLIEVFREHRGDSIAFVGSGEITNENNYIIQKFARVVSYTNNIDTCARLCHASTLKALKLTLGIPVMPDYLNDVLDADCILILGSNPYSNYPALGNKILLARRRGAKVISVQTAMNETSQRLADIAITLEPGTELIFVSTLISEIIRRGFVDENDISTIEGWRTFKELHLKEYFVTMAVRLCQVDLSLFDEVVELVGSANHLVIMHGMGITQTGIGTDTVIEIINLAMLKKGKLISMRGKVNIQGAGDIGCSPDECPSGPIDSEARKEYARIIGAEIPEIPGKNIIDFLLTKPVEVIYICGMNPAVSMPHLRKVHEVLENSFVIYHHPFWTKTAEYADLILPLPTLIETEGTITNAEGCVRKVNKVTSVVPEARTPLWLFPRIAKAMGFGRYFDYHSAKEVFEEICLVQPRYRYINVDELWRTKGELYTEKTPKFMRFITIKPNLRHIRRSLDFPFILLTARSPYHFCTGDITRNVEELVRREPDNYVYMNPRDMEELGIEDDDEVEVSSRIGSMRVKAKANPALPLGILVTRFHFEDSLVNILAPPDFDEKSFTPNYKAIPVKISKGG